VFQPIEETSRLFFSKLLSGQGKVEKINKQQTEPGAASPETRSYREGLRQASDVFHLVLLLLYVHLALIFLAFGPPYIPTLLSFMLPSHYLSTSAPLVLQAYCLYLPVMALNGFLEAFVASTAGEAELVRRGRWMIGASIGFVGCAMMFSKIGMRETGLVYANVVNLGARALYGWVFAKAYFARSSTLGPEATLETQEAWGGSIT
jgi:oligosaccharide translocation protein RFT1